VQKRSDEIIDGLLNSGDEGEDKVTTLDAAIAQNVRPGMTVHFGGEPSAAIRQMLRRFWGQDPQFTLVSGTIARPYASGFVRYGLASKVITSAQENPYGPVVCPDGLTSATPLGRRIETENWSLYSIEQRLMAGALGVGFMPTKSIVGSDMAAENADSFTVIADPFEEGRQEAVVKSLVPDISFVHGCVADRYGNTILPLPHGNAIWGPRASRNGVVVTAERIVSTEVIREYPCLVKIPGYLVRAVCVTPLGAHPYGMVNPEVKGIEGYEADWDFIAAHNQAAGIPDTLDAWVKEWVIDCPSQEDYLNKLGYDRVALLKKRARRDEWERDLACVLDSVQTGQQFSADEMMIVAAAREIKEKAVSNGYRTVLSGAGTAGLAAWLAYHWLREEGYGLDLLWGLGRVGYVPLPGQTNPMGVSQTMSAKMLTDTAEIYGVDVGGRNARCISVLGVLQIDRFGNINNTRVGWKSLGSGGSGDAINANETLVIVKHSPDRVVDNVSYVTCPGNRVQTLVTSMGVFRKLGDDEEFTLTGCFPDQNSPAMDARVREIKASCGWDLKIAADVAEVAPPAKEELLWLRLLDAHGTLAGD